jgi:hypothetical protein
MLGLIEGGLKETGLGDPRVRPTTTTVADAKFGLKK